MEKTVLITGGGGFIGFNLVKHFVKNKIYKDIIIIDNFITSNKNRLLTYITNNELENRITLYEKDISIISTIEKIINDWGHIDEIYHLASLASPPFYKKYPIETMDVGYLGTKNLLSLCLYYKNKNGSCKMLYTSTSEVYGDALEHPQKETYYGNVNTVGYRSCYDESKRIAETLVYTYQQLYNLDTRIIRIFNTYGPNMNILDGRIVTEIIRCLLLGKELTIYGDGKQTRSMSYIDDTINMMLKVMELDYTKPINVGNDNEISINELVEKTQVIYNKLINRNSSSLNSEGTLKVVYKEIDRDDPKVRKPDLSLNKNIIGEIERTTLENGLEKTIKHFMEIVDNNLYYELN